MPIASWSRVHVLVRREGWAINNVTRVRRIYSGLGLQLWNKTPRRRVQAKLRDDRAPATGTHDVWAIGSRSGPASRRVP